MVRWLSFILVFIHFLSFSQEKISGSSAYLYNLPHEINYSEVQFISIGDTLSDTKPTLIFLQGSLPIPLIIDFDSFKHINLPFNYRKLIDSYNLVVISMPYTPVVVKKAELNSQYCFITDSTDALSYSELYLKVNVLETYVERTIDVINHLRTSQNLTATPLYLIGHSQGAKVASVVASKHPDINGVALLGFNAFGRFEEQIRRLRSALYSKQVTFEFYEDKLSRLYDQWKLMVNDSQNYLEGHHTWISFSIDYTEFLKQIKCPVYIGYGTEDIIAENSDLIPLTLIEGGNTNYNIHPYLGLDHNFFATQNGKPDRKSGGHWTVVITDVLKWFKTFKD